MFIERILAVVDSMVNSEGLDQPECPCSLIRAFTVH